MQVRPYELSLEYELLDSISFLIYYPSLLHYYSTFITYNKQKSNEQMTITCRLKIATFMLYEYIRWYRLGYIRY